jgi:hypothetical protein
MAFCPFYNKDCIGTVECAIWNAEASSCGFNRSTSLMGTLTKTISGASTVSVPPSGCFKVTNYYVNPQGKLVLEYDDIPT